MTFGVPDTCSPHVGRTFGTPATRRGGIPHAARLGAVILAATVWGDPD